MLICMDIEITAQGQSSDPTSPVPGPSEQAFQREGGGVGTGSREIRNNQSKIKFPAKGTRRKFMHKSVSPKISSPSFFTCLQLCLLHLHVYSYYKDPGQLY